MSANIAWPYISRETKVEYFWPNVMHQPKLCSLLACNSLTISNTQPHTSTPTNGIHTSMSSTKRQTQTHVEVYITSLSKLPLWLRKHLRHRSFVSAPVSVMFSILFCLVFTSLSNKPLYLPNSPLLSASSARFYQKALYEVFMKARFTSVIKP